MNPLSSARPARSLKAPCRAFTLIELLITLAIIATLVSMLLPSLRGVVASARQTKCLSNQRQLALAAVLYAADFKDLAPPAASWRVEDVGSGPVVYWFGADAPGSGPGTLTPYFAAARAPRGALECPEQPAGSYTPQTRFLTFTTTYGYNGYFLSPAQTPGWADSISHRPWQRFASLEQPGATFVFADSLLNASSAVATPRNSALLDPPMLFSRSGWSTNPSPTTAFRHARTQRTAVIARADASVIAAPLTLPRRDSRGRLFATSSVSPTPDPGYVPDWRRW